MKAEMVCGIQYWDMCTVHQYPRSCVLCVTNGGDWKYRRRPALEFGSSQCGYDETIVVLLHVIGVE